MAAPIKAGLVGLGRAGWGMHCPELAGKEDKFQYVAACDLIPERRERMAAKYGCKTYDDIKALIADPEVEMVDIATRSLDHYKHAVMALEAGKYVFLEKPMCMNYEEAVKLQGLSELHPGKLYIRHNRRFEPGFLHIREIIASGILGEVFEIRLARVSYSRRDDWQTIKEFGGGQLLNWGPHIVDHALQFLESPVAKMWSNLKRVAAVGDAEDHLKIVLTGESGRVVDLEISGGSAMSAPEYIILGTKGGLTSSGDSITLKYLDPKQTLPPRTANPGTPGDTFGAPEKLPWIEETIKVNPAKSYNIWDELYSAIRLGTTYPIHMEEAVAVMRVISATRVGTEF
ncbi:MAG TPA: Gfo/Idh/MocA family oxidoreductase [Armatimonadota bacterium]|nr:Gfo/Idh/MocA family oxidoreductase [Armatimonadota bacterium]